MAVTNNIREIREERGLFPAESTPAHSLFF